jgi:cell division septal protein FtsQ
MPLAFSAALMIGALTAAATWPGFEPKAVAVAGNHVVTRSAILERAAISRHLSIWFQNTRAMARRIEGIPYIRSAAVHRVPPSSLEIVVTERAPFAVLESGTNLVLVDRSLRVLQPAAGDEEYPTFVLPSGFVFEPGDFVAAREAVESRDAYDAMTARKIVPVEIAFDRFGGMKVKLRGGLLLYLGGESELAEKLSLADAIIAQLVGRSGRVAAIDLRAPATPVLVYR